MKVKELKEYLEKAGDELQVFTGKETDYHTPRIEVIKRVHLDNRIVDKGEKSTVIERYLLIY